MTAGVRLQWVPVDPADPEHVGLADRLNAEERRTDAARCRRSRRYVADATLPGVRIGRTDCVYRHEGGCLLTRLRGGDVEVGWTRDGDVWRCSRFGLVVPVADVPEVPDVVLDIDRLCVEAIHATWHLGPHTRLALALATARDAGHRAELAGDGCGLWLGERYQFVPDCSPEDVVTGVRAALATMEAP